jgi:hypothetical protein
MTAAPFVMTAAIRDAVEGREVEVLRALGIPWSGRARHIRCPFPDHDDKRPSWRWDVGKLRAFCTCGTASIFDVVCRMRGIGFEAAKIAVAEMIGRTDLIRPRAQKRRAKGGGGSNIPFNNTATPQHPVGCTFAAYAATKQLPLEFLKSLGMSEIFYLGKPAIRIPYFDASRNEVAVRFRVALDGDDKFRWRKGSNATLYGLDRIDRARKDGEIAIGEGESDCHTLWNAGFAAVGLPGASTWNEARDASLFDGFARINVVIEPDNGGESVFKSIATSRIRDRVRLVRLNPLKDVSALYLDDPARFSERWRQALAAAVPWQDEAQRNAEAEAARMKEAAGNLIGEPNILGRFAAEVERIGLVGEAVNAKIMFLALTSRLFERPVSVAIKGVSSGGKSFTVERVLQFFPVEAYFERTGMSERALAYSDEDFRHRHLVIYEAAGMTGDFASYLIRSLLSEGRIRYELVEKTSHGLKPRLIVKEGPTGLITTTTAAKLHPENETRLLSLAVKDTAEQTRAVMLAIAADQAPKNAAVEFEPWHALQRCIAHGERRVSVPYAAKLAALIPPAAVRLRRDFKLLLTLVRAHALLHRETRDRDHQGSIVATISDYAAVRDLIVDVIAEGVEARVPDTVRQTVEAVRQLGKTEVSLGDLVKALKLDKSAVHHRVRKAIERGYLVNHETGKGRPARIGPGEPMPDTIQLLPAPDLLERCTVEPMNEGMTPPSAPTDVEEEATWTL